MDYKDINWLYECKLIENRAERKKFSKTLACEVYVAGTIQLIDFPKKLIYDKGILEGQFFSCEVSPGQGLNIELSNLEKGIQDTDLIKDTELSEASDKEIEEYLDYLKIALEKCPE